MPTETERFLDEAKLAAEDVNSRIAEAGGVNECYFQGVQWLSQSPAPYSRALRRWVTDYNPSSHRLRVTDNDLTRLVIKARTATHPERMHADVAPALDSSGLQDRAMARSAEDLVNLMIESTGFLECAQQANDNRAIRGAYGIGLRMERIGDGEDDPDLVIKAFGFEPQRLILDPGNQSRNLRDHDYVIYCSVMSKGRLQRVYGISLEDDQLTPMGQLLAKELSFNEISNGRLYGDIRAHSKTPAAVVYEIYRKGGDGRRFDRYEVLIETAKDEAKIDPFDGDDSNPWGGDGLPFVEIFGHRRGESRIGISDVDMMREDQDRRNLLATLLHRCVQKSAHYIWKAEKGWFEKQSDEDIRKTFTNLVGGIIIGKGSDRSRNIQPPSIVDVPQPPAILEQMIQLRSDQMREKAFRADVQFGQTKSHVAATTQQQAARSADDVASIRVQADIAQYERLLLVLLGTGVRMVQAKMPTMASELVRSGFTESSVAQLLRIEAERPQVRLSLRDRSVRFRSHDDKRRDIDGALERGAVTPDRYRLVLAKDLDTALTGNDTTMSDAAMAAADAIVRGLEWQPRPLGEYVTYFLDEFLAATTDRRAEDPAVMERLVRAIEAQQRFEAERAVALNPEFIAAQMQAEQQTPQQGEDQGDTIDIASLVQQAVG